MKRVLWTGLVGLSLVAAAACSSDDGETGSVGGSGASGGSAAGGSAAGGGGSGGSSVGQTHATAGVTLTEIAIYQGVKRSLMVGGEPVDSDVPLIAGRDALLRVFYTTDAAFPGGEVTGRLNLAGGEPIEVRGALGAASTDAELESTLNFEIPGDRIADAMSWSVEVLSDGEGEDSAASKFPAEGLSEVAIEGKQNTFRLILAPFRYTADGSGRLPNLDEVQVAKIRDRIKGLYPVSDVEVTVREPADWSGTLSPNGDGWQSLGITLSGFRNADGESADVYYYGIFNPAETFRGYCGNGCLLGVTLLNNSPPDVGTPFLRLALGVGYENYAAGTAAHELGHAHGREHVDCGGPDGVDRKYPYDGETIGSWGYDITSKQLKDPAVYSDIMGYCSRQHISDYTYRALHERGQRINQPYVVGDFNYDIVTVDGSGQAEFATTLERQSPIAGDPVDVTAFDAHGARAVRGEFFRYDHLPGGWLLVPQDAPLTRAEFVVEGVRYAVQR